MRKAVNTPTRCMNPFASPPASPVTTPPTPLLFLENSMLMPLLNPPIAVFVTFPARKAGTTVFATEATSSPGTFFTRERNSFSCSLTRRRTRFCSSFRSSRLLICVRSGLVGDVMGGIWFIFICLFVKYDPDHRVGHEIVEDFFPQYDEYDE